MVEQQKQEPEIPYLTRTQVLVAMGATAILLWIVAKLWLRFGDVSLFKLYWNPRDLFLGLGLGVIITVFSGLAYRFFPPYRKSADYYLELVLKPLVLPDLIWLGLLPGLSEELLFRGVMLPALGADHVAVIVSSLCFGVLHLSGSEQWPYVIWASIIGMIFGYSALLGGNLLVPIVAHILTNWLSSSLWKMRQLG
ncbi:CPBP family intramembrane metalloprotease [Sphaerospermopsis aphanizomenoides BCCUSP55]|uniref:CPBP family intramembrane glutamic endopeptidase n=1 Tax=Sphaerospermopsis aphanizomenoides TaxID=459663 RepID=UPI000ACDD243|nr:CPBP family intramembrane glutamic endopeptidase [Sphaerospermopsis aphanizomenoides]MBK1989016.1 CPBP family intramembrane metalloprotease [Sphaerospermopsis aphanizomenoides BCCUSP55]